MTDPVASLRSAHDRIAKAPNEAPTVASTAAPAIKEYIVQRDGARPLSFAGVLLAQASTQTLASETVAAAVFRTAGGKFISTFTRHGRKNLVAVLQMAKADGEPEPDGKPDRVDGSMTNKAEVFDTVENAAAWFKPGRLTDSVRKQLGLDEPIRIE